MLYETYVIFLFLSDPPWAPGKPTVKDVAKTTAFLQWTKPEHDGGAKIESYIIELLKSGTDEWVRVADGIPSLEYFLRGLMEKQEYSFRVRAVNAAGESEPSEPSDPVLCKERLSKPHYLKIAICHHLFILILFQTYMTFLFHYDTTEEVLNNVCWSLFSMQLQ